MKTYNKPIVESIDLTPLGRLMNGGLGTSGAGSNIGGTPGTGSGSGPGSGTGKLAPQRVF